MPKLEVLFSRDQIAQRVAAIGAQISQDFAGESVLLVGVLKGAVVFLADLARYITIDATYDFITVSSYKDGKQTSGRVNLVKDVDAPVEGNNVIIVEDILDSGFTLNFLYQHFTSRRPKRLAVATLLDKRSRRIQPFTAEYVGFEISDRFVVGYGMDIAEQYRNLPDICVHTDP
jgi:hypoxanthine phosphoribosyltransferase